MIYGRVLRLQPEMQSSLDTLMSGRVVAAPRALVEDEPAAAPDEHEAWFNLGVAEQHNGRHERAVNAFRNAARLRPESAEAWQSLGMALHHRDVEGAKAAYAVALAVEPELPAVLWNCALLLEKTEKLQEAAEIVMRLVQAEPRRRDLWFRLAWILVRSDDFEGAAGALRKCPDLAGDGSDVDYKLGTVCWQLGDVKRASRCFEEMLKRIPGSHVALRALAAAAIRMESYPHALEWHRRLAGSR